MKLINTYLELAKIRITIFVTFTTMFGYICASGEMSIKMIPVTMGIFFLACGSAALNHIQERKTDLLMDRTKNRPIPSGKISLTNAIIFSITLIMTGSLFLFLDSGLIALLLGLLTLIWYNLIYTPLKKKSTLAIIPGSVIGAIPPVVGWVAAGGDLFDQQVLIIAAFFFIWQIPHFWLLLLVFGKDYEQAGFPVLTQKFSEHQLARITFIWTFATALTALMIPLYNIIKISYASFGLAIAAVYLIFNASKLLNKDINRNSLKLIFREINVFAVLVILLISFDKLIILF